MSMEVLTDKRLMSQDRDEVKLWFRGLHTGDLLYVVKGRGPFDPLKRSKLVKEVAEEQLALRDAGAAKMRGILKSWGKVYTGTSGWWVSPFVTPDMNAAFVDTARGVAVIAEGVKLDEAVIEALTVPDQGDGVKASGAAAWTSPDVGEGHNASAPPGWMQLVCDIRTFSDWPVEAGITAKQKLVCYGLVNCYKERSLPSKEIDEGYPEPDPTWWHFTEEQSTRAIQKADEWVRQALRQIVKHLPNSAEILKILDGDKEFAAHKSLSELLDKYPNQREESRDWPKTQEQIEADAIRWFRSNRASSAANHVCDEFWVSKVFFCRERGESVIGWRWIDHFRDALTMAVYSRLEPIAANLRWMLDMSGLREASNSYGPHRENFTQALGETAKQIAKVLCHKLDDSARDFVRKELLSILYENGPVYPT
jgi:hypothetical protein